MSDIVLLPGATPLADWCAIYRGARGAPRSGCLDAVHSASADTVARIVPGGRPSTASIPVSASSPACASTRRTCKPCSATSCCPMRPASASRCRGQVTRLMMALKLASLAQGASGIRPQTLELLAGDARADIVPLVPAQGSVGASGDLAPLAHMTAAMIGVGEAFVGGGACRRLQALERGRAGADRARAEGRAGAAQRHAVLHRLCAGRAVRGRGAVSLRARHRRARHRCGARLRHAVRCPHPSAAPARRPDRIRRSVARPARRQRHPRLAPSRRRAGAGPLLPALPAAGDGRVPRRAAQGRRHAADRSQRRVGQPADLQRRGRGACPVATSMRSRWRSPPT